MKITPKQFSDYILGWLGVGDDGETMELTMDQMKAALKNSLAMLEDDQDGIVAVEERWELLQKFANNMFK
jgi:hypothetical protein